MTNASAGQTGGEAGGGTAIDGDGAAVGEEIRVDVDEGESALELNESGCARCAGGCSSVGDVVTGTDTDSRRRWLRRRRYRPGSVSHRSKPYRISQLWM